MKVKIIQQQQQKKQHKDLCTSIGWSSSNELFSCSDDKTMCKWSIEGEMLDKVMDLDVFVTDMHWLPSHGRRSNSMSSDIFVIACSDGSFCLMHSSGRAEKVVKDAHQGAVTTVRWNNEGTALMSGGEDGVIKIWSRGGQHRATLASTGKSVYSIAWGPTSEQALFTSGKDLVIKPIHSSGKQLQWKAHEGCVTKVDWNPLTNLIVSASEDGRFKVWDTYGRVLYASKQYEHSITSVAWNPCGDMFAVGMFNMIKICDKSGWSHVQSTLDTGSILDITWTEDGTEFAVAGGNGAVRFGHLIELKAEWKHLIATLVERDKLQVHDILNDTTEVLEFREKVVKLSIGFGYLVVVTASQCWIYDVSQWNTPHMIDIKGNISIIQQCSRNFLLVDNVNGIQVHTYEGRLLSNPKFSGLRAEFLDAQSVSISSDTLAVIDKGEGQSKVARLFDTSTGSQIGQVSHEMEIVEIKLSQLGTNPAERMIAIVDRNCDMYITTVSSSREGLHKLSTMVDSVSWNDSTDILVATGDGKFTTWLYPYIVFVDRDLLPLTHSVRDMDVKRGSRIVSFHGTRATVRLWNGSNIIVSVSPHMSILYELAEKRSWESMIRLCRFVKDRALWASLSAMSIKTGNLSTAEVALAAIDAVDKLQYILYIQSIPSVEGRNAELALYTRRLEDAETILRQSGLIYRAIKMHIRLYNWSRALELAESHKSHVNTVLAYRRRYLESVGRSETSPNFMQYESVTVDWEEVQESIKQEKEAERQRASTN